MHGGLFSRDDVLLDELKSISRNRQPPDEGTEHKPDITFHWAC